MQPEPQEEKKTVDTPTEKAEKPERIIIPRGSPKEYVKEVFIREFPRFGTILATCNAVGVDRTTIYRWREDDPEFNRKFEEADTQVTETLERTAMARALRNSDTLLIFLLKARNPEKYKERIQQELDPKIIDLLVTQFVAAVKKHSPDYCPHCKSHLGLPNKIAKELSELSSRLAAR